MRPPTMKRVAASALAALLLVLVGADAACVKVENNQELVEYSCEGGSVEDIGQVPNEAEKIRISNMSVGRVSDSLFSRFGGNLLVLTCSHCGIGEIDAAAFRGLANLQQLSLDNNRLSRVSESWFRGLKYLTYLDLNYNQIERVDGEVFRHTPELVDLRLSGNRLECLDIASLSSLPSLKRIFINENPQFGCPNAMRSFLVSRGVDFEADPHWSGMSQDRVAASRPLPVAPEDPRARLTTYRAQWTTYAPPTDPPTRPPTRPPTVRPYVPEMIQPSAPNQEFSFQAPFYPPRVPQQQLDNYRSTLGEQARNASANASAPNILLAGYQPSAFFNATATNTTTTTTECPPNGARPITRADSALLVPLGALLSACAAWTRL